MRYLYGITAFVPLLGERRELATLTLIQFGYANDTGDGVFDLRVSLTGNSTTHAILDRLYDSVDDDMVLDDTFELVYGLSRDGARREIDMCTSQMTALLTLMSDTHVVIDNLWSDLKDMPEMMADWTGEMVGTSIGTQLATGWNIELVEGGQMVLHGQDM